MYNIMYIYIQLYTNGMVRPNLLLKNKCRGVITTINSGDEVSSNPTGTNAGPNSATAYPCLNCLVSDVLYVPFMPLICLDIYHVYKCVYTYNIRVIATYFLKPSEIETNTNLFISNMINHTCPCLFMFVILLKELQQKFD